jgi:fucose permease
MSRPSILRKSSSLVLSLGFSLTGAGTVMLGVLLPVLAQRWHLHDNAAGFLFFLQFLGSSLGAVLTGVRRVRAMLLGYGILIVSAGALGFAGPPLVFAVFFFWGLGLGMAMTATSLYVSDRSGDRRAANLERLNFAWSAGAMAAPILFLHFLGTGNLRPLYGGFLGLFALAALWIALREREEAQTLPASRDGGAETHSGWFALAALVILAMCAVGVESSLSGWLTTYSHRADPRDLTGGALATSLFWLGILVSRLVASTRLLALLGRSRVLNATLYGTAASVILLIAAHHGHVIDAAAGLGGLSIGPVYPLLLSFLLERSPQGWIFAVAGLGSALFPWATGALSERLGSLRYGLIAPCAAAALMIVLRFASAHDEKRRNFAGLSRV